MFYLPDFAYDSGGLPERPSIKTIFQELVWCKPDWRLPSMSKETNELLHQCTELPEDDTSEDLEQVIKRSQSFPIPFPVETVRLHVLQETRPIERLQRNISSTYVIIHERVLIIMTQFLVYKREFGSNIEKNLYKDMTVPDFIDRLLTKKAVVFISARDKYMLMSGEKGVDGWENIGTPEQRSPLLLENCLSYDEIKLSSFLYTSGFTECINNGDRYNSGRVGDDIEEEAVIIGTVGPRFSRQGRMECEEILVSSWYSTVTRGYGEADLPTSCKHILRKPDTRDRHMWRHIWADLYQVPSFAYEELTPQLYPFIERNNPDYTPRYVRLRNDVIFDNEVYYKRIAILAECALIEANKRAKEQNIDAYLNVIGCGLGIWKISNHQIEVYVLTFLERIQALLKKRLLDNVADVNFAFIKPSSSVQKLFTDPKPAMSSDSEVMTLFFENSTHPRGGIRVWMEGRTPSSKLREQRLLVLTSAADPNALPGNEFWIGSLTSSGDPATACSTQVSELHNPHLNLALKGANTRVVTHDDLVTLSVYCRRTIDNDTVSS